MTGSKPADLLGTQQQQLIFLNTHWGSRYTFKPPRAPGGLWTANAKSGGDEIRASTAAELLEKVRRHSAARRTQHSRGDQH